MLAIFTGVFGVDRFYLGYIVYGIVFITTTDNVTGVIKCLTLGGLFVWYIVDIVLVAENTYVLL